MPRWNCPSPKSTLLLERMKEPPSSLHPCLSQYHSSLVLIEIKLLFSVYINLHVKPRTLGSFLLPMCLCPFTFLARFLASSFTGYPSFMGFPLSLASSLNISLIFLFRLKLSFSLVDIPFLSFLLQSSQLVALFLPMPLISLGGAGENCSHGSFQTPLFPFPNIPALNLIRLYLVVIARAPGFPVAQC